jgi:hypothetical protein
VANSPASGVVVADVPAVGHAAGESDDSSVASSHSKSDSESSSSSSSSGSSDLGPDAEEGAADTQGAELQAEIGEYDVARAVADLPAHIMGQPLRLGRHYGLGGARRVCKLS